MAQVSREGQPSDKTPHAKTPGNAGVPTRNPGVSKIVTSPTRSGNWKVPPIKGRVGK